jgi:hypothetical protein
MNHIQKKTAQIDAYMRQNDQADPFGGNVCASLSYKRSEKIAVALNLIVSRMRDADVLKREVQQLAVNLLKDALALRDGFRVVGSNKVNDCVATVRLIVTHLDVLHAAGHLSDTNLEITKSACVKLVSFLRSSEDSTLAEGLTLTQDYFETNTPDLQKAAVSVAKKVEAVRPERQDVHVNDHDNEGEEVHHVLTSARREPNASIAARKYVPRANFSRREALLAVVDSRGEVTIKDLTAVVPGISEKTIQRELQSMITDGVLTKEGERRWTTYKRVVA